MKQDLHYWLTLWRMPGIGPAKFFRYLKKFPDLSELFAQPEFAQAPFAAAENDLRWANQTDHHIITILDPHYPQWLKEITYAPPLLFVLGDLSCLQTESLAMVGSRHASAQGIKNAQQFASELAQAGWTITSGLALGIDAVSHQATLDAKGKTIAVMATGADQIYPKRHEKLAHQIRQQGGALITEFPLGTPPQAEHFPRRNRIISGISRGLIVVEAGEKSGSLITARYAMEQNREVFAIPGSIQNPLARGCHQLIRQGATLVDCVDDVLHVFNAEWKPEFKNHSIKQNEKEHDGATLEENILMNFITFEPLAIDLLIEKSKLSTEEVTSHLLFLELKGFIRSTAQGYVRV